jgi:hypothetical protein
MKPTLDRWRPERKDVASRAVPHEGNIVCLSITIRPDGSNVITSGNGMVIFGNTSDITLHKAAAAHHVHVTGRSQT